MKILLISYDYFRYDGRVRELVKVAKLLGDVTYVTRGDRDEQPQEKQHIVYKDHGYMDFIRFCGRQAKKLGKLDLIFIDNRKGIIPGYLAKKISRAEYVVQDCRELYSIRSASGIPGKIGCLVEKMFTRHSDVVIAANAFRARIMVKMFGLKKVPLNYENIRRLEYSGPEAKAHVEEECREFFKEKKFRIISTAGCDVSRTTSRMVQAMKGLGGDYELFLIGESDGEDELVILETIRHLGLANVKIFPRMDQDHLKYFIENSQVGMVTYHQHDLNNKYCASGKIYEFLFEGKPVVTSTNPPLADFCGKYGVGIAEDNYGQAIRTIAKRYGEWQQAVEDFTAHVHVEKNNEKLAERIRRRLEEVPS